MANNSRIDKSPYPWSGAARDKITLHPMVRPNTKFLWDSREPLCHPTGAIVAGNKAAGTVFKTLKWPDSAGSHYGPDATVVYGGSGNQWSVAADGAITSPAYTNASYIQIGAAGQFDMAPAEYEYLAILWWQPPASGYTTGNYTRLFDLLTGNANDSNFAFDTGGGGTGLSPRAQVGTGTGSVALGKTFTSWDGLPHQFALHYKPSGTPTLEFYVDGVLNNSTTSSVPSELQSQSTAFVKLLGAAAGDFLGFSLHDIGASVTAETAFGTRESADIWTAAQHVAKDYAYGKGTLTSAPSTSYA